MTAYRDGVPVPTRLREAIRAKGPTVVYGDEERKKLERFFN